MGLQERIITRRHETHMAAGRQEDTCPLCRPLRLPTWRMGLKAKDMTRTN